MTLAAPAIDLTTHWGHLWSALEEIPGVKPVFDLLAIIGMLLLVWTILHTIWANRREGITFRRRMGGDGGGSTRQPSFWWTFIFALAFTVPTLWIPIVLGVLQVVVNAILNVWTGLGPQ